MTDPVSADPVSAAPRVAGTEQPWQRLNTRMLLVHVVTDLIRAAPALIGLLFAGSSSGRGPLWGLAAAGVAVLTAVVRWVTTRYRITASQVQLRTGLVRRRRLSVPLDRVRTVDVQATLMHRLVGLTRVKLGTGRSTSEKEHHLTLDGLSAGQAERLRNDVLHGPAAGADAAHPTEWSEHPIPPRVARPDEELARLDLAWIRYGPFTMTGLITVVAVAGLVWRVVNEAHVNPNRYGAVRAARDHITDTAPALLALQAVAGLLVLVAILSTAGYVLAFWRFRLTRAGDGTVHVSRGLLTTRATTIEGRRLRGAELSEPLLLRAVRGARLIAVATGLRVGRGAERGGEILLPPAPRTVVLRVGAAVCASGEPLVLAMRRHPAAALRRRLTRAGATVVVLAILLSAVVAAGAAAQALIAIPVAAVLLAPLAVDRYRSLGHGVAAGYLVVREGALVRRRTALGVDAIIGWNVRVSFFQRRSGVATLVATTACGRQKYRAVDMAADEVAGFAANGTPGLLTPFLVERDVPGANE